MTLVVIHNSTVHDCLMAYADSRIGGAATLTESAGKLLPLPFVVFNEKRVIYRRSFGFAFAGSALVSHSIFSFLCASLQSLRIDAGSRLPNLEEISRFSAVIAKDYIREIGASQGIRAQAEVAIFGYCPISDKKRVFVMRPDFGQSEFNMTFGELTISNGREAYFLGDKKAAEAFTSMNAKENLDPGQALQRLIKSGEFGSIGGNVQVLRVDRNGARHLPTIHRTAIGKGAHLELLGKRIEDFGGLGGCSFRHEAWGPFDE